jgi:S1-C subfamily serine protease
VETAHPKSDRALQLGARRAGRRLDRVELPLQSFARGVSVVTTVRLSFTTGARSGAAFDLPSGRFIVGRSANAQLALPDAGVSGSHAEIAVEPDGRVFVTDLGSSNGTWVDGDRLTGTWLIGDGTELRFGPVRAVLHVPQAAAARSRKGAAVTGGRVLAALVAAGVVFGGGYALSQALEHNGGRRDARPEKTNGTASTTKPKPKPKPLTRTQILARARAATVRVSVTDGWGSGWVMGFDQGRPLIVTNAHVVGDATSVTISSDRQDDRPATVLGVSQCDDLAVVRAVDAMKLPALTITKPPEVGDAIWIVGFPGTRVDQDSFLQVHGARVASVGATYVNHERDLTASYRNLVQVDGVINAGNSGGPLVEEHDGRVVGVATFGSTDPTEPEYYGIASDRAAKVLPYLRQGTSVPGMELGFEEDNREPRILEVSSHTFKNAGVESDGGQRLVAINGKRFDQNSFPKGLTSVCDALPELGNGKSETVKYTIRKPDGQLLIVRADY